MNYKNKKIILSIFFILSIQVLLLVNNRQKTSFRYFIWNVEEISIGRLVFISFISGLLISSLLDKTIINNAGTYQKNEEYIKTSIENDTSFNREDSNEINEIPPERDLRDTQPTISVNYRVIKDNSDNESDDSKQISKKPKYQDDWNNKDLEW
tara:strand:+ start:1503 stop:1961 length:459 start_codon:yes stop_codon:yes gene_type:complete